jgi:hypothetical protein
MAKKSKFAATPEITTLPISGGDSALVIDLPDGQKLVVSNLAAGSVIEVATWRGTGRPDSRTSRLMLGMSSAQDKATDAAPNVSKKPASSTLANVLEKITKTIGKFSNEIKSRKQIITERKSTNPFVEKVSPPMRNSNDVAVDDWLDSILEKSAKKQTSVKSKAAKSEVAKPRAKTTVAKKSPRKTTAGRAR